MSKLNTVLKAVFALTILAAFIFVSGTTGIAGTDSTESSSVSFNAEKSDLALNKVSSKGRTACGDGKCGGSDKKAEMKAKATDAKDKVKELKKEGKCGAGECGGSEKKADIKDAKKMSKGADCEGGKCGDGKCGGSEKKAEMKAKATDAKDKVKEVKK